MAPSEAPSEAGAVALDVLLRRIADEIDDAHRLGSGLEGRLGAALPSSARFDPALSGALQSLDRLNQTTAELAAVVGRLSGEAGRAPVDAAALTAPVTLRDLAGRLRGGACEPAPSGGEVDLF